MRQNRSLTSILFLLYGGVLADRLPRGPLLVGSSVVSAASQAMVAAPVLTHSAAIPLLMVLAAANGASSSCYQPTAQALLPQTVPTESRRTALALSRIAGSSAMMLGASLGGVLIAAVGPGWGLAVDALSFALAAASFALVRVQVAPPEPRSGLVHELRVGWREFTARCWVWLIVGAFCLLNAGITVSFTVLGPAVADTTGIGRTGWGLAVAASSLGAVAGGVLSLSWRPRRAILVGCALMGLTAMPPLVLALAPYTRVLVLANFVGGRGRQTGQRRLVLDPQRADPRRPPCPRLRQRQPPLLPHASARPVRRQTRRMNRPGSNGDSIPCKDQSHGTSLLLPA
ncbi:MFS transporter [Streptomyces sp. NPDC096040]|uniref:MFS transporter n=1 Tax=Streptomyces sp. NPDC096040 TaxID=3155541 RepID=UPI00332C5FF7